jgi:hypothetical protein
MKKKPEIYYYEDPINIGVHIGIRGDGREIYIPGWDMIRAGDSFAWQNGRRWTFEEALQWAIKWTHKESEYVDFEEIKPEIRYLT